ncbi:MAG: ADOP family duplicated permease, partial [Gemmatimonas sp.]
PLAVGQPFDGDERSAEATKPVAVLSHAFWQRRFGGDSSIAGRTVSIAGHPVTIVGVLSRDFSSSVMGWTPDVLLPLAAAPTLTGIKLEDFGGSLYATARLRRDISAQQAGAELDVLMRGLARTDSARYERATVRLDHARGVNAELRGAVAAASAFLMGMVALVLLIACANVANLLLGRAAARQTEIGVRLALGASRARIIRQLLTESLMLGVLGTVIGLSLTFMLTRVLTSLIPAEAGIERAFFAPDGRVLIFTGSTCVATTLLFGLVPALRASSPRLVPMLKADVQGSGVRRSRGGLLATQAALCVVLLAVASLFLRSLQSMRGLDSGFRVNGVVNVPVDLDMSGAADSLSAATFERILRRAGALPGVQSATLAAHAPLTGSNMETRLAPQGMTVSSRFEYHSTYFNVVAAGYFETLGIPLMTGRGILETDRATSPRVAVINETAAKRWWPNQQAVGKQFLWGGEGGRETEVIGIARDADYNMPGESQNVFVYLPLAQQPRSEMTLQMYTTLPAASLREAVWTMLREEAPALPPPPITAMAADMSITLLPVRTGASLLGALGLVALLLAATGIYGVTTYAVARRTREIGIRAALGAGRTRLLRMVVSDSLRPVMVGLGVGLSLALLSAVGLSRVLYGVRPIDMVVLPGVAITLLVVSLIATLAPARRASAVDPVIAMRSQ